MSKTVYFISGSSRGIGLEMVRQIVRQPDAFIVAAARNPSASNELQNIIKTSQGRVVPVSLDVTSEDSISAAVRSTLEVPFVKDNNFSIDVLYNVAGTASGGEKTATQVTAAGLRADIDSNYIGTVLTTLAFLPLLQSSPTKAPAKVIYMSTLMASHSLVSTLGDFAGVMPGYSASKSAGNMWFQKLALEITGGALAREGGWIITMLHPGLVETDMGKGLGGIEVDVSVRGILKVVEDLKESDSGSFWDYEGQQLAF